MTHILQADPNMMCSLMPDSQVGKRALTNTQNPNQRAKKPFEEV